jgi:hypothetical protein
MQGRSVFGFVLALVGSVALASAARAQLPDDIAAGVRVEIEARAGSSGSLVAREVEVKRAKAGDDEVEGAIEAVDAQGRSLRVGGIRIALEPDAVLSDGAERALALDQVKAGQHASAEGRFADGVLRAASLEVEEGEDGEAEDVELEGTVGEVDRAQGTFRLLGLTVKVTPQTKVELH